jgi:predicted Zn-dependent protease
MCMYRVLPVIVSLFLLTLSFGAYSQEYFWNADDVAKVVDKYPNLRSPKSTYVVSADQIREIIKIKGSIEHVAGDVSTKLYIYSGKLPNAKSSHRDGYLIAINTAMLDVLGDDQSMIAALIGHELAHIYAGHKNKSVEKDVAGTIIGILLAFNGVPLGGTIGSIAADTLITPFERDQEREADRMGIEYCISAGYDPNGAVKLFTRLKKIDAGSMVPFLSTHPTNDERVESISKMIADRNIAVKSTKDPSGKYDDKSIPIGYSRGRYD